MCCLCACVLCLDGAPSSTTLLMMQPRSFPLPLRKKMFMKSPPFIFFIYLVCFPLWFFFVRFLVNKFCLKSIFANGHKRNISGSGCIPINYCQSSLTEPERIKQSNFRTWFCLVKKLSCRWIFLYLLAGWSACTHRGPKNIYLNKCCCLQTVNTIWKCC